MAKALKMAGTTYEFVKSREIKSYATTACEELSKALGQQAIPNKDITTLELAEKHGFQRCMAVAVIQHLSDPKDNRDHFDCEFNRVIDVIVEIALNETANKKFISFCPVLPTTGGPHTTVGIATVGNVTLQVSIEAGEIGYEIGYAVKIEGLALVN